MGNHRQERKTSVIVNILRSYLRTNLRGRTRLTFFFSRILSSLRFVPIRVGDCEPFYVNMQEGGSHELLKGDPWKTSPFEYAEQYVMQRIVRDGEIAFDIGANIGLHTVLLSKLIGPNGTLCVFEPNDKLLPQLELTVEGLNNAVLHPLALSNKAETAVLFVPEDAAMSSLANWTSGREDVGEINTINCEVRRIDDLIDSSLIPQPDFIKCDVEGAELLVFQGGSKTLNRVNAPIIMFEANVHNVKGFGLQIDDAKNHLANLTLPGYSFYEIQEDGTLTPNIEVNPVHSNILAVPESKLERTLNFIH